MGRNWETMQCSKHLLSTYWVLKSRVQGGRSESLRLDWLTGRGKRGDGFFNDPHPRSHICVPSGQTAAQKIEVRLQKGLSRDGQDGRVSQGKMEKGGWFYTHQRSR